MTIGLAVAPIAADTPQGRSGPTMCEGGMMGMMGMMGQMGSMMDHCSQMMGGWVHEAQREVKEARHAGQKHARQEKLTDHD